ncbi:type ISP restriction/modification enzyme [Streptomyces sp. NPDC018031]|uniref:type ISP restriction/modification enzyme n=1 Tax=Streptomyces sp. NPDC018031 TaxID=3365033 RepID=UPI0037B8806E
MTATEADEPTARAGGAGTDAAGTPAAAPGGTPPPVGAPALADLMPWAVAPLRLGRGWVLAPDAASLTRRWDRLVAAAGPADRAALFRPTRARTLHSAVAQLPGQATSTGPLAQESGRCPAPVRIAHGPFDQGWLIPDHRLLDAARPELWRIADDRQLFVTEPRGGPAGPALTVSALLPDGHSPAGRPGAVRPLYRRPGGREPNLAAGLTAHLGHRLGEPVGAGDVLAWICAAARPAPAGRGCAVPLTADREVWERGVRLGRRLVWLMTRGARAADRPRLPGGRRPYVRAALPPRPEPGDLAYDPREQVLGVGPGRISPVAPAAWEFHADGAPVLETWFERRVRPADPGTLEAVRPAVWPQEWTSELLELVTVLTLLAEAEPERRELAERTARGPLVATAELRAAGVLPVTAAARRPASVLDHPEEGPGGQFALL